MQRGPLTPPRAAAACSAARAQAFGWRGEQVAVIGLLLVLAGGAWVATAVRMAGMDAGPGTDPGALGFYLSTWVVMMAAMMLPAIVPMVLTDRDLVRGRQAPAPRTMTSNSGLFIAGYLAVWASAGLLGYAALKTGRALDGGFFAWGRAGRWAAAAVLLSAALYELTARKGACLDRCRSPRRFLLERWREGRTGALRMGIEHGVSCLGCCWALMAALFALGAMSIAWMAVVSALIVLERLLPWRTPAIGGVAIVLAALAIGVAAAPTQVPALTIPGSPAAMRTMGMTSPRHLQSKHTTTMVSPSGARSR